MSNNLPTPEDWKKAQRRISEYGFPWGLFFKGLAVVVALVVVVALIAGPVGMMLDWYGKGQEIFGPENVSEQWDFTYSAIEDLEGIALQVCLMEEAVENADSEFIREQRRTQLIAYQQNYYRIQQDYDARVRNLFEAKLVKPPDVPEKAPNLETTREKVCAEP